MKCPRILIVEDDPDIVETLRYSLEAKGFAVDVSYDGLDALRKARKEPISLMLLDIMLPGKNGYEVSRILKQEMAQGKLGNFPILVLTARKVSSAEREDFLKTWSQADEFMYKPFDLKALLASIERHIASRVAASAVG